MTSNLKYLKKYGLWYLTLLFALLSTGLILWLADIRVFQALIGVFFLSNLILIALVSYKLISLNKKKEKIIKDFLSSPDYRIDLKSLDLFDDEEKEIIKDISDLLHKKDRNIDQMQNQLIDFEDYVEKWAHEIKLPLSLLNLLLDNGNIIDQGLSFKLDYIRNQMDNNISQILFYNRTSRENYDYYFEDIDLEETISDVLTNYQPLLREKNFTLKIQKLRSTIHTDKRGFEFIIGQIVNNAIKYSGDRPRLEIFIKDRVECSFLIIRDNGIGVKACDLPHIFEKSFTGDSGNLRKSSTGIGLFLSKKIAEDLGLSLEAESEWGKGFQISIGL